MEKLSVWSRYCVEHASVHHLKLGKCSHLAMSRVSHCIRVSTVCICFSCGSQEAQRCVSLRPTSSHIKGMMQKEPVLCMYSCITLKATAIRMERINCRPPFQPVQIWEVWNGGAHLCWGAGECCGPPAWSRPGLAENILLIQLMQGSIDFPRGWSAVDTASEAGAQVRRNPTPPTLPCLLKDKSSQRLWAQKKK